MKRSRGGEGTRTTAAGGVEDRGRKKGKHAGGGGSLGQDPERNGDEKSPERKSN